MGKPKKPKNGGPAGRNAAGTANIKAWRGKAALKHGIRSVIDSGGTIMPAVPGAEEIREEVDALISEAISDLGGPSELTAQRKIVLESQRLALLVLKLAGAYLVQEGLINRKGRPHALLAVAATYANSARLNALALGLARVARKIGPANLSEYLEQKARETEVPAEAAGQPQ